MWILTILFAATAVENHPPSMSVVTKNQTVCVQTSFIFEDELYSKGFSEDWIREYVQFICTPVFVDQETGELLAYGY